jgi:arylsulfatase A-like enzyme
VRRDSWNVVLAIAGLFAVGPGPSGGCTPAETRRTGGSETRLDGSTDGNTATSSRTSIVWIMADDLGYGDLPAYGGPDIRTPNIDRLGAEGVRFTDFYGETWCAPARVALFSGRYPQRVGDMLPIDRSTLGPRLKAAGYRTGIIGKWHVGSQPSQHGFDHFFGFSGCCNRYFDSSLVENGTPVVRPGYLTDILTQEAVAFIERSAGQPFFLHVAFTAPHDPYQAPDGQMGATRSVFVSMVERLDEGIGAILAALDRTGILSNALVIFTGDNGGVNLGRNAPLSGVKWSVSEGGIRVPAFARWPGVLRSGLTVSDPVALIDITASLLRVARVDGAAVVPPLDGLDVLGFVQDERSLPARPLFWRYRGEKAVREGDLKLVVRGASKLLFDVRADPGEQIDLAQERPEAGARLDSLLTRWETEIATNP